MADFSTIVDHVWHLLQQGGWFMLILFVMGQVGWMMALGRWWAYRSIPVPAIQWGDPSGNSPATGASPANAGTLERRVIDSVRGRGPFADLVRDLSAVRHEGEAALVGKARELVGHFGHGLNQQLSTIAALAAAAPMMGLAGTISGVMATFAVITQYGAGNPSMMAGGIAEALMVTEAALVIAIPLIILHDRLQARADALEAEAVSIATALIREYTAASPRGEGAA